MSYGVAVWALDDMHPGRVARGAMVVLQSLYRRLITPRGMLLGGPDEENFGIDLEGMIGSMQTTDAIAQLPGVIQNEFAKDERVAGTAVTIVPRVASDKGVELVITINVVLHDEDETFQLVLAVSEVTTELVGIEGAA